jgi:hypothetical protein
MTLPSDCSCRHPQLRESVHRVCYSRISRPRSDQELEFIHRGALLLNVGRLRDPELRWELGLHDAEFC